MMIVKSLRIENNGEVFINGTCDRYVNILQTSDSDVVRMVLRGMFGLPFAEPERDNQVAAWAVVEAEELFVVNVLQCGWWYPEIELSVKEYHAKTDSDCTADYLAMFAQGDDDREYSVFRDFAAGFPPQQLQTETDPKAAALREEWIRGFKPRRLREDKPYEVHLCADGRYVIRGGSADTAPTLSETEAILYQLCCFFDTAAYSVKKQSLLGTQTVSGPLLIEDALGWLDDALDRNTVFELARYYSLQSFFVDWV